jgi:hypothetical protein
MLTYAVIPILAVVFLSREISLEQLGLKVRNPKGTVLYAMLGVFVASMVYLLTDRFFHQQWINGYISEGLVFWILLVTTLSVFSQTFFYNGLLFNRYVGKENTVVLGLIAVFAFQSYVAPNSLPWLVSSMLTFSIGLAVTWKTRNVYGATVMAVVVGMIELTLQII